MRWTRWRRKTCGAKADGEVVWSWRLDAGVNSRQCFALRGDGDKKARSPGRARRKPLKPLRREGRESPANLWWTYLRAFYFCTRSCGCASAPGFPCALSQEGLRSKLGRPRVARLRHVVIASEAKQSSPPAERFWIASSLTLLAMTFRLAV